MNTKIVKDIIEIQIMMAMLYAYNIWAKSLIKK